jgi:membrane-bound metal-dependent hydrolase YbcI (DUF457 family)
VDIVTHALLSFALARGFFPRRCWPLAVGMIAAGTLADVDLLSILFGPSTYLAWHNTYTHSVLAAAVIIAIAGLIVVALGGKTKQTLAGIVMATSVAAAAHLLLDLCQSDGTALLWPLRATRFASDLFPGFDPWNLTLLIAGIALPELFRLVSSEIGAKEKAPRGRNGALVALALIVVYTGARYTLHSNSVALLDAHTYRGESPRKLGAYPDALSIFTWHGVAETQSMLCQIEVPAGPEGRFDAESAICQHKPAASPQLAAAQGTTAAREFLRVARFPKATVEKTANGYEVVIGAFRGAVQQETRQVIARILLDANAQVQSDELLWAGELRKH